MSWPITFWLNNASIIIWLAHHQTCFTIAFQVTLFTHSSSERVTNPIKQWRTVIFTLVFVDEILVVIEELFSCTWIIIGLISFHLLCFQFRSMNTHLIARFSNGILLLIRQLVSRIQIIIVRILFLLLELLVLEFNWTKLEHRLFEAFCIQDVLSSIMLRNTWPDSSLEVFNYLLLVKWLRFWLML